MNEKIGYTRELVSFKTSLAWTFNQRTGNRVCYLYMLYKREALAYFEIREMEWRCNRTKSFVRIHGLWIYDNRCETMCLQWFLFCALLMLFAGSVSTQPKWTHGQRALLLEPPQRSSLWRFGNETPLNINDSALNCGGFEVNNKSKQITLTNILIMQIRYIKLAFLSKLLRILEKIHWILFCKYYLFANFSNDNILTGRYV